MICVGGLERERKEKEIHGIDKSFVAEELALILYIHLCSVCIWQILNTEEESTQCMFYNRNSNHKLDTFNISKSRRVQCFTSSSCLSFVVVTNVVTRWLGLHFI